MSQDMCNLNIKQGREKENHLGGENRWQGAVSAGCEGYHVHGVPQSAWSFRTKTQVLPLCPLGRQAAWLRALVRMPGSQSTPSLIGDLGHIMYPLCALVSPSLQWGCQLDILQSCCED